MEDFSGESPSELPSMDMPSAPSGTPPLRRRIFLGIAMLLCGLVVLVVASVILSIRLQSTSAPTTKKLPEVAQVACNFLSIPNLTACQSTLFYNGRTIGRTIPSEIGLLTNLTVLDFAS